MVRYLAVLGTQSHSGKSVIVTALCRVMMRRGYLVAPFKAQNMSLNSWITREGKEIGIAQAIQAFAAGVEPNEYMNPVLLKPKGDMSSQVVVLGTPLGDRRVGEYYADVDRMLSVAKGALQRLSEEYEVIVIEGAGGAAEINLYGKDIANLGIARATAAPIVLVGDIERGGIFASLYGTYALLPEDVRKQVKGFIINKFRGDPSLLKPGLDELSRMTGVPVLGVIPYRDLHIPSEDSVSIADKKVKGTIDLDIAVVRLPFISNFTDFEPLERIARVRYVPLSASLGSPDVIILPGTKNTVNDLRALNNSRLKTEIREAAQRGTPILGICGGYQMLGERVIDSGIEGGKEEELEGLALLPVTTRFEKYEKITRQTQKTVTGGGPILEKIRGTRVRGYEIHMGKTTGGNPAFEDEGCVSETGTVIGTYLHGLFSNRNFTRSLLEYACKRKGIAFDSAQLGEAEEDPYEELADLFESSVDVERIISIIFGSGT